MTEDMLPADRPLLAALLRALPAGVLLTALGRTRPRGSWWWRSGVLGVVNIAGFFALLFIAATRLPGGVASTIVALQPLIVAGLSALVLPDRVPRSALVAGATGVVGVGMLVLPRGVVLDGAGVVAALGAAVTFAVGVVLIRRWQRPPPMIALTGWQLLVGGIVLLPLTAGAEGFPHRLSLVNLAGFTYIGLVGTAVAYVLWFRGIVRLPAWLVSFLALLSPVVAIILALAVHHERLSLLQGAGAALVLGSLLVSQSGGWTRRRLGRRAPEPAGDAHGAT